MLTTTGPAINLLFIMSFGKISKLARDRSVKPEYNRETRMDVSTYVLKLHKQQITQPVGSNLF